ncbi:hypothetical protein EW145_g447 [Phellinidium pouzarii]|uniref:Calcineurin-like phosphoesterase domain-containing protein n=1 Tax=Phellinidium pouzarii TaxID=167371 RepID=A0A4S4LI49_9AGAM|nr:hypothetical protein EW145_g447 [Phellinidium pouzarii]
MVPLSLLWLVLPSLLGAATASPVQVPLVLPADAEETLPRKNSGLKGRFLHLTDMHPDPHFRVDSAESTACHRRKPKKEKERSAYFGLPYGDCDSPLTLTNFTLDFLEKHWAKEVDFVIWTGDSARHDNDRELPRTPDEIYTLNRAMVQRMNEVFTSRGIPVVPSLGNNDVWRPNSITNEFSKYQDTILGQLFGHMNVDHFFFLQQEDTILLDDDEFTESRLSISDSTSARDDAQESSHSSLAESLMEDFSELPKKAKTDLDDFSVINVGPSVVPNPYLPTFRVFAYNISGVEEDGALEELKKKKKKEKKKKEKKTPKRKHGHKHPGKEAEVDCKKKENRETWACRPKKPQYASPDAPSRTSTLWTPLGYAQYWLPDVGKADKSEKPKFRLEYATFARSSLHPGSGAYPIPLKELPMSLRTANETAEDGQKYMPYGLRDLTIGSWLGLARRLGEAKKGNAKVRAQFRQYMYQGAEQALMALME